MGRSITFSVLLSNDMLKHQNRQDKPLCINTNKELDPIETVNKIKNVLESKFNLQYAKINAEKYYVNPDDDMWCTACSLFVHGPHGYVDDEIYECINPNVVDFHAIQHCNANDYWQSIYCIDAFDIFNPTDLFTESCYTEIIPENVEKELYYLSNILDGLSHIYKNRPILSDDYYNLSETIKALKFVKKYMSSLNYTIVVCDT
jgi:hypothetical protein